MARKLKLSAVLLSIAALGACAGEPGEQRYAQACANGLDQAENELLHARTNGIGDAVKWTKAASLIAAARVQETFDEYQNCVFKVRDARAYIRSM